MTGAKVVDIMTGANVADIPQVCMRKGCMAFGIAHTWDEPRPGGKWHLHSERGEVNAFAIRIHAMDQTTWQLNVKTLGNGNLSLESAARLAKSIVEHSRECNQLNEATA